MAAVPLYFFHVNDGIDKPDLDGTEFPNDQAARVEAVVLLGELLRDKDGSFWYSGECRMKVVDEAGATVCTVTVAGK